MAEEQDESQKTEEPSRKRLDEAAERGQVVSSRETMSFTLLLVFTLLFYWVLPIAFHKAHLALSVFIERPDSFNMDGGALGSMLINLIQNCMGLLIVPFMAFICGVILTSIMQSPFVFSFEPLVPKLEKISIFKGIERLFSMRALTEFGKSMLKIILIGAVAYYAVAPFFLHIKQLPSAGIAGILVFLTLTAKRMLVGICIAMFFIALFDYLYQRYEYMKGLRMSKQEVKDEYKQQEGDPQVKRRLRQIRMERARRRMIAAVPTSDVIITNPTHYSVALKYDSGAMRAPKVVAKGLDNIALRIREIAKEHSIPLVENPPLAQALYATVDIDKEIPTEHYKAVAEVISYVYKLRGKIVPPAKNL